MEAFKSFKAYQYFADGLVANVCTQKLHREDRSLVIVKEYCFASPKAKTTYTVHIVLKTRGEIVGRACTCVAGKGQAYIHIQWNLTYPVVEVPGASVYRAVVIASRPFYYYVR